MIVLPWQYGSTTLLSIKCTFRTKFWQNIPGFRKLKLFRVPKSRIWSNASRSTITIIFYNDNLSTTPPRLYIHKLLLHLLSLLQHYPYPLHLLPPPPIRRRQPPPRPPPPRTRSLYRPTSPPKRKHPPSNQRHRNQSPTHTTRKTSRQSIVTSQVQCRWERRGRRVFEVCQSIIASLVCAPLFLA